MSIEQKMFGSLPDGTKIHLYTLTNTNGVRIQAMEYGARVVSIQVPDRKGNLGNVVLGHDTLEEYLADGDFLGAAVGRYANRIAGGKAEIDGTLYSLSQNENGNTLHGGFQGFHQKAWRLKCSNNDDEAPSITFAYRSADGEEGFPGNLDVSICYTLTTDNALVIDYTAKTDVSTLVNLTNHSFFNLTGDPARDILSHELQIHADFVTAAGEGLIPTGELVPVAGTPGGFPQGKNDRTGYSGQRPVLAPVQRLRSQFCLGWGVWPEEGGGSLRPVYGARHAGVHRHARHAALHGKRLFRGRLCQWRRSPSGTPCALPGDAVLPGFTSPRQFPQCCPPSRRSIPAYHHIQI